MAAMWVIRPICAETLLPFHYAKGQDSADTIEVTDLGRGGAIDNASVVAGSGMAAYCSIPASW
jgi:hypothetical protein